MAGTYAVPFQQRIHAGTEKTARRHFLTYRHRQCHIRALAVSAVNIARAARPRCPHATAVAAPQNYARLPPPARARAPYAAWAHADARGAHLPGASHRRHLLTPRKRRRAHAPAANRVPAVPTEHRGIPQPRIAAWPHHPPCSAPAFSCCTHFPFRCAILCIAAPSPNPPISQRLFPHTTNVQSLSLSPHPGALPQVDHWVAPSPSHDSSPRRGS